MPRQLPWLNSTSRTKTGVKPSSKAVGKRPISDGDPDDDFFKGTVLETSRKGKGRADPFESDEDLSEEPVASNHKENERLDRALSSSPPAPGMDVSPPPIEFMKKGVDKFNLYDDEWMMVEDEFMETAKLFTKHLHFAHYETMREEIAKKKNILRPVIPSSAPSVEASYNQKARAQAKAQRNAINDVLKKDFAASPRASSRKEVSSSFSERSSFEAATPSRLTKASVPLSTTKRPSKTTSDVSDSDDLDAPSQRPSRPFTSRASTNSHTFMKPALPPKAGIPSTPSTTRARPIRPTSPEFFDDPPFTKSSPASSTTKRTIQPTTRLGTKFSHQKPKRSLDILDDYDPFTSQRDSLPKEQPQTDRVAKRKAERKNEDERDKRKSVKLGDIPTFLF